MEDLLLMGIVVFVQNGIPIGKLYVIVTWTWFPAELHPLGPVPQVVWAEGVPLSHVVEVVKLLAKG